MTAALFLPGISAARQSFFKLGGRLELQGFSQLTLHVRHDAHRYLRHELSQMWRDITSYPGRKCRAILLLVDSGGQLLGGPRIKAGRHNGWLFLQPAMITWCATGFSASA